MKKLFVALSVLAALALSVVPSQALIGMPDDVPGCNVLQAFFVVEINGNLDTAVIFQETGGLTAGLAGNLHWHMWDVNSNHVADSRIPYTQNDVVAVSVRSLINDYVGSGSTLETTLPDGTQVYLGYITWQNEILNAAGARFFANNMLGKMYLHDMSAGQAAGVNLSAREWMPNFFWDNGSVTNMGGDIAAMASAGEYWPAGTPTPIQWLAGQGKCGTLTAASGDIEAEFGPALPDAPMVEEAFTATSLAASIQRERGQVRAGVANVSPQIVSASAFALYPRYYLHDANAQSYVFLWKSVNGSATTATFRIDINVYDTAENVVSKFISVPSELNVIDARDVVPPAWIALGYPCAGFYTIQIPDIFGNWGGDPLVSDILGNIGPNPGALIPTNNAFRQGVEFVAYSWQYASSADTTLNWSALFPVARDVNFRYK